MSLAKLLNLIILVLFLIGALLLVSLETSTVRRSVLDQMQANLETSTTAMGLVLQGSLLGGDKVLAETIVNAMFDGGFVRSATLTDPDGKVLFRREFSVGQQNVPAWFQQLVSMPPVIQEQEMTDGWNILGTIRLEGHSGYAYQHLWQALRSEIGLLLIGLAVMLLLIQWSCHRLLAPLRQISSELDLISQRRSSRTLPTPWLQEVKGVVNAVNRLISERQRDLTQQRLKLQQLAQQFPPSPFPHHHHTTARMIHFISTQGDITLYRAFIPAEAVEANWHQQQFEQLLTQWYQGDIQGLRLPMSLLQHPQWYWLEQKIRPQKGKILDWRYEGPPTPSMLARLKSLQTSGIELAFHDWPLSKESLVLLELHPRLVATHLSDAPLLWNMAAQCVHAHGTTLLEEGEHALSVDTLRNWGIDGYRKEQTS